MINAVHGSFAGFSENFIYILTSGGVEYSIEISLLDLEEILSKSEEERKNLKILTYLIHREDAMLLYGFLREEERKCFIELLTVNGIGAKQALKVLSSMKVEDFLMALDKSDVKKLSKIPGMGPKTAQKLILQLRNVLILESPVKKLRKLFSAPCYSSLDSRQSHSCQGVLIVAYKKHFMSYYYMERAGARRRPSFSRLS